MSVVLGKAGPVAPFIPQRINLKQSKAWVSLSLDVISTDRDRTQNKEGGQDGTIWQNEAHQSILQACFEPQKYVLF